MKNAYKITTILTVIVVLLTSFAVPVIAEIDHNEQLFVYFAELLGYSIEDIYDLYIEAGSLDALKEEINTILSDIVEAEQWNTNDTTVEGLKQISQVLNIDISLLQRHINICGADYFTTRVKTNAINLLSDSGGSSTGGTKIKDTGLFNQYVNNAHNGNIFLTKDSVNAGYRHGHCGIVSEHTDFENKKIVEALGNNDDVDKEVVEQSLSVWGNRVTLAIYYPNNTTTAQRENAGYYAKMMEPICTYKTTIKKGSALDTYPKVNCISLVYLAYLMSIGNGYDLVPQVSDSSYLYPSNIQFSSIISLKTTSNGMLRTSNWNDYDWGW